MRFGGDSNFSKRMQRIEIRIFDRNKKSERLPYSESVRIIRMWQMLIIMIRVHFGSRGCKSLTRIVNRFIVPYWKKE